MVTGTWRGYVCLAWQFSGLGGLHRRCIAKQLVHMCRPGAINLANERGSAKMEGGGTVPTRKECTILSRRVAINNYAFLSLSTWPSFHRVCLSEVIRTFPSVHLLASDLTSSAFARVCASHTSTTHPARTHCKQLRGFSLLVHVIPAAKSSKSSLQEAARPVLGDAPAPLF